MVTRTMVDNFDLSSGWGEVVQQIGLQDQGELSLLGFSVWGTVSQFILGKIVC